ncbi:MAG: adenylate/guanylate cyclase domain-containing protein [Candidatus Omnitrophica bacterium]|nr:adenylate/guanylate cyclase domain-containing protein [Candidatus Omnitrophota bacterium]
MLEDIQIEIKEILETKWSRRDGYVVPDPEDIELGNDAVSLKGTVLYADLAESTALVKGHKDFFAAEVYKAYLVSACRLIRFNDGVITAFDGDRVMAVFIGDSKNSSAAKTALMINYIVKNVINKAIKEQYPNTSFQIHQTVGIDTSNLFVARTGIRGSNDLVWVGRAANYAAKLCSLRQTNYASYITKDVFEMLSEQAKNGGTPKQCMWEKIIWSEQGIDVYRLHWWWKPD